MQKPDSSELSAATDGYPCDECGTAFNRTPTDVKRGRRFCRWDCHILAKQKESVHDPCVECGTPFKRTAIEVARGRKFCSRDCYEVGRKKKSAVIKEARNNEVCANDDCSRTGTVARGLCGACYQYWNVRFGRSATWKSQNCPVCKTDFPTHTDRTYCSLSCYVASDAFRAARQRYRDAMAAARKLGQCLQCAAAISVIPTETVARKYKDGKHRGPRRFCGKGCYRQWFAERFDRVVADYKHLEIPMTFDEFLSQDELPCLIDGCEWVGKNLSTHCNATHGITAAKLKALAGFNRTTGVVGRATHDASVARQVALGNGNPNINDGVSPETRNNKRGPIRAEGREHLRKSRALREG
jgi:hypothetical protein